MIDIDDAKRRVCAEVDRLADRLVDASHRIHAHPELNFEEVYAHDLLTSILDDLGRAPERHVAGNLDGPWVTDPNTLAVATTSSAIHTRALVPDPALTGAFYRVWLQSSP